MSRKAATCALIATSLTLTVTFSRADESDSIRAGLPATAISVASYPPERTIHQSLKIGVKTLNYRVTAGAIPVTDESGNTIAAVTFVAYLLEDTGSDNRPVTFAMNGGPGNASANLNGGGIGPKRLVFDPRSSRVRTRGIETGQRHRVLLPHQQHQPAAAEMLLDVVRRQRCAIPFPIHQPRQESVLVDTKWPRR